MTINAKGKTVSGREAVNQTIKFIKEIWRQEIDGFLINWKKVDNLSDNIDVFNIRYKKYIQEGFNEKLAKEKAYFDTFSGKMAIEQGFTKMKYIEGIKDSKGNFTSIEGVVLK